MVHSKLLIVTIVLITSVMISFSYSWFSLTSAAGDFLRLHNSDINKDELESSLERASMGNRTVIISVLNKAYTEKDGMLDLFLRSFRTGKNTSFLLNHLLLVNVDQKSHDRCKLVHHNCYKLVTEGVDFAEEVIYKTPGYLKMMWRKTWFVMQVLKRNYNILFTDMDVVFFRNPFKVLKHRGGEEDFQFSCDNYLGDPYGKNNTLNNGFYFVLSNNKTIRLFEMLYARRDVPGEKRKKQQTMLAEMKNNGTFRELGLKVRYHDVKYFAGFCSNKGVFDDVCVVHANCCRTIKAKSTDLTVVLEEWDGYVKGTLTKNFITWTKHKACSRSWDQKNDQKNRNDRAQVAKRHLNN